MKHETIEKARRTKLYSELCRSVSSDARWCLRGNEFTRYENLGLRAGYNFACAFFCNLERVRVVIEGKANYGIEQREQSFTGEDAWADCIEWLTDNITEMDAIVQLRDALARPAQAEYFRKLQGE